VEAGRRTGLQNGPPAHPGGAPIRCGLRFLCLSICAPHPQTHTSVFFTFIISTRGPPRHTCDNTKSLPSRSTDPKNMQIQAPHPWGSLARDFLPGVVSDRDAVRHARSPSARRRQLLSSARGRLRPNMHSAQPSEAPRRAPADVPGVIDSGGWRDRPRCIHAAKRGGIGFGVCGRGEQLEQPRQWLCGAAGR